MYRHGFTFLEILFSLFLVSVLLLGMDAMLFTSLRHTKINLYYTSAIEQLAVMSARLKILPTTEYGAELTRWNLQNHRILPQGHGFIQKQGVVYNLVITWGDLINTTCPNNKSGESGCIRIIYPI